MRKELSQRDRRDAILVESFPFGAGLALLAFDRSVELLCPSSGCGSHEPFDTLVILPIIVMALLPATLLFPWSGIGWMMAGRVLTGLVFLLGRAYIVLWVYGWAVGDVDGQTVLVMFSLAMAIAAVSVLALAYWTRPRASGLPSDA